METTNTKELSIQDIMYMLLEHKKLIIISMVICFILSFVYFKLMRVPIYTANTVLYVNCMTVEETEAEVGISEYQIDSSRALTTTYMQILQGRSFLKVVSADLNYKYTVKQLASMVSISALNETELLRVAVSNPNAEDAYLICKSISDNAAERLLSVFKGGAVEVVDETEMPQTPSSTGMAKVFVLGAGMGFILGAALAFLINLFDNKIRNGADLQAHYDITVVGEIVN